MGFPGVLCGMRSIFDGVAVLKIAAMLDFRRDEPPRSRRFFFFEKFANERFMCF